VSIQNEPQSPLASYPKKQEPHMSIGKRVSDAIDKMGASDPEGALFAICAALEATAAKEFGKPGRSSYKDFVSQNLGLITNIAFGRGRILNLRLDYDHPEMKKNSDGVYPIEEILYHAVRCGLYHTAGLPSNLRFVAEQKIYCNNGALVLPASFVYGLITAVIVAPVNAHESASKPSMLNLGEFPIPISRLWGRRVELLWLLDAVGEVTRLRLEAQQDRPNQMLQQNGHATHGCPNSPVAPTWAGYRARSFSHWRRGEWRALNP
jgi:hypothetical protein